MKVKLLLGACLAALLLAGTAQAAEAQTFAQAELFQAGSLTGDYTRPGGLALMDAGEEALYTLLYAGMQNRETSIDISKLGVNCGSGGLYQGRKRPSGAFLCEDTLGLSLLRGRDH